MKLEKLEFKVLDESLGPQSTKPTLQEKLHKGTIKSENGVGWESPQKRNKNKEAQKSSCLKKKEARIEVEVVALDGEPWSHLQNWTRLTDIRYAHKNNNQTKILVKSEKRFQRKF